MLVIGENTFQMSRKKMVAERNVRTFGPQRNIFSVHGVLYLQLDLGSKSNVRSAIDSCYMYIESYTEAVVHTVKRTNI